MTLIGYHASHEQFPPGVLLEYVQRAERAGFTAAMSSDHFHPWSERQAQSGFAWAWLGAALATTRLSFGMVNAPGDRYHPAIIAQAAATLAQMYPQRVWCAFGTGQALNEHITGQRWINKADRRERLLECVSVIRALWRGETFTFHGRHITIDEARLYTLPTQPPLIVGAAVTEQTAAWVGSWADAMITVYKPLSQQRKCIEAFWRGGGEGKPMFLQAQTSYAITDDTALSSAYDQWRGNIFPSAVLTELRTPEQFDQAASLVKPDDLRDHIRISSDISQHIDWLHEDIALGFERIFIHNVNREQERFIDVFGEHVLPQVQKESMG